jgi:SAM-dependent methyltransferase
MLQPRLEKIDLWRYERVAAYCVGQTLDVACGLRGLSRFVSEDRYIGCDLEGGSVRCSAYDLPFRAMSFDTVVLGEVLEHLEMPVAALKEASRVCRRRMIITVPNDYSLVRLSRLLLGRPVEIEKEHILSFNSWNIAKMLRGTGMEMIESFCFPLRLQCLPEIPVRSRFGYWLFVIADRTPGTCKNVMVDG